MICNTCTTRFTVGLACPKCAGTTVFPHPPEIVQYLSVNALELIVDGKGVDAILAKNSFYVVVARAGEFVTIQGGYDKITVWQPQMLIVNKDMFDWEKR